MKVRRVVSAGVAAAITLAIFSGFHLSSKGIIGTSAEGSVYYLNCEYGTDEDWQRLATVYTRETGIPVKVVTVSQSNFEEKRENKLNEDNAPTLFKVTGLADLEKYKEYCYDLTDSDIVDELISPEFKLEYEGATLGVAYSMETYGLIYNKELLKKAGYTEDDIRCFDDLKKVTEDITGRSDELGFSAFTSSGMNRDSIWRFKTQLTNLPIYYEYQEEGITNTDAIKGSYLDHYRAIWDLYINHTTTTPDMIDWKTNGDAINEFVTGQAVFLQNGTWVYDDVASIGDENLGILPIYIGAEGEEEQGLCTGSEDYWCVNKNASKADIQATLDFIDWCVTSSQGIWALTSDYRMGLTIPYKEGSRYDNTLVDIAKGYIEDGKTSVTWCFDTMPSEQWKDMIGFSLITYAKEQTDENWALVEEAFVDGWASEKEKVKEKEGLPQ